MRYNFIGDIHGRTIWKDLLIEDGVNIFMGDYFDPYDNVSFEDCMKNMTEILEYKKQHHETVLLMGNHDMQYLIHEEYSRKMYEHADEIENFFRSNVPYFEIAFKVDDVIAVHAGLSVIWIVNHLYKRSCTTLWHWDEEEGDDFDELFINHYNQSFYETMDKEQFNTHIMRSKLCTVVEKDGEYYYYDGTWKMIDRIGNIVDEIDEMWYAGDLYSPFSFACNSGPNDCYGDSSTQGPLWIRPWVLSDFKPEGYTLVIGHTHYPKVISDGDVWCVDCLGRKSESLIYDSETKNFSINH